MDASLLAPGGAPDTRQDTRQRLIAVAVDLFTRHSFAGTSLQMIADEMGLTKAAIYHHFRTREQLLNAVLEPVFAELREIVDAAAGRRTAGARAEAVLRGYVELAVRHRALVAVLAGDPSVADALGAQADRRALIERQLCLLAGADPAGMVKASFVLAGISGACRPRFGAPDDDELRAQLLDAGRRALGLRSPRR
ncbi:TetR/AcrR family transcriptional regulator [Mycobacterium sp. MYCO198283]|uniref:TetR/AcrR family transcriptional regulator n=1 Tax=Mycobacterium sp. MYCO198283 TaxID=2883505 RepID=UPI001E5F3A74|nr:TetR/AcrR family transcriptional regulator [Mycobacterium sp. MYCO198283]MCG5433970.1 TetR/AcrR family transcriptional regulator [Mycobacterium sp. MYCO198283]